MRFSGTKCEYCLLFTIAIISQVSPLMVGAIHDLLIEARIAYT